MALRIKNLSKYSRFTTELVVGYNSYSPKKKK
jgi:hypothetical protein